MSHDIDIDIGAVTKCVSFTYALYVIYLFPIAGKFYVVASVKPAFPYRDLVLAFLFSFLFRFGI
jgi:hypothetical protein